MKNIIFGNSDFAFLFYESAVRDGLEIEAFTVNRDYVGNKSYEEKPIIAFEELESIYSIEECKIYLCVGYRYMNSWRENIYNDIKSKGYIVGSFAHSSSIISSQIKGEGNIILEHVIIGSKTYIGNCNIFYPNVVIAHNSEIGNCNYFSISASIAGNNIIGNNCFFGNNCTTKDGINISDSVLIGAGAFAHSDILKEQVLVPVRSMILDKHTSDEFFH